MGNHEDLVREIKAKAVVRQHVTLASGIEAGYYLDLRRITFDAVAAPMVGREMLSLTDHLNFDAVGGLTMGADPVAAAMMHVAGSKSRSLDAFSVRKEVKTHGLQRRVEGPDISGRRVLVVEDTSTTGGSVLTALNAVRAEGAIVVAVAVIVDRDTGSHDAIAAAGVPYLWAVHKKELGLD